MELPSGVPLEALARTLMEGRSAAWCRLDGLGEVLASGGGWQMFGESTPAVGDDAQQSFAVLQGLLPVSDPLCLRSVDLGAQRIGDLHLIPDGEGTFICLLDSTQSTNRLRGIQQQGNELELLHGDLAQQALESARMNRAGGPSDQAVFEMDAGGTCKLLSRVHDWLRVFLEDAEATPVCLAEMDPSSFLGNFLVDAQEFWAGTAPGSLSSGPWIETFDDGVELQLEALALLDPKGARGLILKRLPAWGASEDGLLQGVRESNLSLERLKSEAQKKEVLLQCIVHDLRGPLSSMSAALSILGQASLAPEKREHLLAVAGRQARRQDEMMREILSVFAAEVRESQAVERSSERAPDLAAELRLASEDRGPALERAGLTLDSEIQGEDSWKVPGNGSRLGRVIGNLLDNALSFSPPGGEIQVRVQVEGDRVRAHVLDRGPGVSVEKRGLLFQRFSQAGDRPHAAQSAGGSVGLGLFYCRTTLEAWGGAIGYSDRPGGGADFWFELPLLSSP
ncbi:MAG: HAMP domain-containing histidine kinase [Planctomycetes bacterium]|nr:HAMP domain-containing histidine kinase [Planctomycetota bacterium]